MKIIAVNGERMVPPVRAAMLIIAHSPGSPNDMNLPSRAPSAPPMISSGASTPPDVPDPNEMDQTTALPINSPITTAPTISPLITNPLLDRR